MTITNIILTHYPQDVVHFGEWMGPMRRTAEIEFVGNQLESIVQEALRTNQEIGFTDPTDFIEHISNLITVIRGIITDYNVEIETHPQGNGEVSILYREKIAVDIIEIRYHEVSGISKIFLDTKYPHVCFSCKKELKFKELWNRNVSMGVKRLKKLWKSQVIEFYCCECFKKAEVDKLVEEYFKKELI